MQRERGTERILEIGFPGRETTQRERHKVPENGFPGQGDHTARKDMVPEHEFTGWTTTAKKSPKTNPKRMKLA